MSCLKWILDMVLIISSILVTVVAASAQAENIRVRLASLSGPIELRGSGIEIKVPSPCKFAHLEKLELVILTLKNGQWDFYSTNKPLIQASCSYVQINADKLSINGESVPKNIRLYRTENKADVVASVNLEKYLMGVLPHEMPANWPLEALKAQAVASRTYVLHHREKRRKNSYHVDASVLDQVYRFEAATVRLGPGRSKVRAAIAQTRGQVLVGSGGATIQAYYHADCGGVTAEPDEVWGNGIYWGTTLESHFQVGPHSQWKTEFSVQEISRRLRLYTKGQDVRDLKILARSASGRAGEIVVKLKSGPTVSLSGTAFREAIGYARLKSTLFEVVSGGKGFVFTGRGYGHGVGMSQWGGRAMALKGLGHGEILAKYYPAALLANLRQHQFVAGSKLGGIQ